jgi:ribosomal protein L40E
MGRIRSNHGAPYILTALVLVLALSVFLVIKRKTIKLKHFWILPTIILVTGASFLVGFIQPTITDIKDVGIHKQNYKKTMEHFTDPELNKIIDDITYYVELLVAFRDTGKIPTINPNRFHYDYTDQGFTEYFNENYGTTQYVQSEVNFSAPYTLPFFGYSPMYFYNFDTVDWLLNNSSFATDLDTWMKSVTDFNRFQYFHSKQNSYFTINNSRLPFFISIITVSLAIVVLNTITITYRVRASIKKAAAIDITNAQAQSIITQAATDLIEQSNERTLFCRYCGARNKATASKCDNCGALT